MTKERREGILQGVNQILLHNLDSNYFNPSSSKEYREWLEKEVSKEIIKPLHSQGVVIEVKGELPDSFCQCCKHYDTAREDTCNYGGYCGYDLVGWGFGGYVAVEPLIEVTRW